MRKYVGSDHPFALGLDEGLGSPEVGTPSATGRDWLPGAEYVSTSVAVAVQP
jgi:hypothetical protein